MQQLEFYVLYLLLSFKRIVNFIIFVLNFFEVVRYIPCVQIHYESYIKKRFRYEKWDKQFEYLP